MTKTEAIQELLTYDHLVISGRQAMVICEPFRLAAPKEKEYPDAHREDGKPVIGVAAHDLAEHLCSQLDIDYVTQFGKGSQLRVCCKALSESF